MCVWTLTTKKSTTKERKKGYKYGKNDHNEGNIAGGRNLLFAENVLMYDVCVFFDITLMFRRKKYVQIKAWTKTER